ncbi:hypothetical protein BUALT_Bualt08G0143900 [Buddleja alternifolia]|uniref:Uncharacterized protein n=1 Tax=Buddleja alternifolia TaxID=168488 RepID=A0AAV6XHB0_9LAMI|nr:hypothetical protein BUALT_Bualt08G0143900 [Buddleja alternifolia]
MNDQGFIPIERRKPRAAEAECEGVVCVYKREGLADSPSTSSKKTSGSSTGLKIFLIFIGLLAVVAFSVFLYKLWQRKKREQQHARLLKLFEQDDDLEVELGIRD